MRSVEFESNVKLGRERAKASLNTGVDGGTVALFADYGVADNGGRDTAEIVLTFEEADALREWLNKYLPR